MWADTSGWSGPRELGAPSRDNALSEVDREYTVLKCTELVSRQGSKGNVTGEERSPDRHAKEPCVTDEIEAAEVEQRPDGGRGQRL